MVAFFSEDILNSYVKRVKTAMQELTAVYANLIERIEENILEELGLEGKTYTPYFKAIKKRYAPLKNYLLTDKQKIFKARLFSEFDSPEKNRTLIKVFVIAAPSWCSLCGRENSKSKYS